MGKILDILEYKKKKLKRELPGLDGEITKLRLLLKYQEITGKNIKHFKTLTGEE